MSGTDARPSQGPARGYSWPPFEKGNSVGVQFVDGNDAAERHGAWSARKVQPLADALHAELLEAAPWASAQAFAGTVQSWAWAEGQAHLLRSYVDEHGHLDADGEERPAVRTLDRIEGRLAKLRDQLGLNPSALAKLLATAATVATVTGVDGSFTALHEEGRRILAARPITATATDTTDQEST